MVEIKHALHFVTEVDETHPVGMQLLALEESARIQMLEGMLKEFPTGWSAVDVVNRLKSGIPAGVNA